MLKVWEKMNCFNLAMGEVLNIDMNYEQVRALRSYVAADTKHFRKKSYICLSGEDPDKFLFYVYFDKNNNIERITQFRGKNEVKLWDIKNGMVV